MGFYPGGFIRGIKKKNVSKRANVQHYFKTLKALNISTNLYSNPDCSTLLVR